MPTPEQIQQAIRNVVKSLYLRIISSNASRVSLQTLMNESMANLLDGVERMHLITLSMCMDVLKAMKTWSLELARSVVSLEEDVDQFMFYLLRLLRSAAIDPALANHLNIDMLDCLDYQSLVHIIESVADHAYNTAMLSLLLVDLHNALNEDKQLDAELVMRIAIVHDLPECKYQDFDRQVEILLGQDKYQEFKSRLLTTASTELLSLVLNEDVKNMWKETFDEAQSKKSLESQFVAYVDKMEVLIQALSYESLGYHATLFDDFWKTSKECSMSRNQILSSI